MKLPGNTEKERARKILPFVGPFFIVLMFWVVYSVLRGMIMGLMGANVSFSSVEERVDYELVKFKDETLNSFKMESEQSLSNLRDIFGNKMDQIVDETSNNSVKVLEDQWFGKLDALRNVTMEKMDFYKTEVTDITSKANNVSSIVLTTNNRIRHLEAQWQSAQNELKTTSESMHNLIGKMSSMTGEVSKQKERTSSIEKQLFDMESAVQNFRGMIDLMKQATDASSSADSGMKVITQQMNELEDLVKKSLADLDDARRRQSIEVEVRSRVKAEVSSIVSKTANEVLRDWKSKSRSASFLPVGIDWSSSAIGSVIDTSTTGPSPVWKPSDGAVTRFANALHSFVSMATGNYENFSASRWRHTHKDTTPEIVIRRDGPLVPGKCFPLHVGGTVSVKFLNASGHHTSRRVSYLAITHPRSSLLPSLDMAPAKVAFWGVRAAKTDAWVNFGEVSTDLAGYGSDLNEGGALLKLPSEEELIGFAIQILSTHGQNNNGTACVYRLHAIL